MRNSPTLTAERQELVSAIAKSDGKWNLASLSRAIGRNDAYLHQYLHRQSPRRLPEGDRHKLAEWLGVSHQSLQSPAERLRPESEEDLRIPFLNIETAAGHASVIDDFSEASQNSWHFTSAIISQLSHSGTDHLRLITVRGDSMAPQLEDGDVIMLDLASTSPHPAGIFVLDDGHGLVVKYLELMPVEAPDMPQKIRIISTNPAYAPYRRAYRDIRIIGRVIWMARAF